MEEEKITLITSVVKRYLLFFALSIVLAAILPRTLHACSLATPDILYLYQEPPKDMKKEGGCLDDKCEYTLVESDDGWGILSTQRYQEISDWIESDHNNHWTGPIELADSAYKQSLIQISGDWKIYTLIRTGEEELGIVEFVDLLEYFYPKRVLSIVEVTTLEDLVEGTSWSNATIIRAGAEINEYDRKLALGEANDYGCPVLIDASHDVAEIYIQDYTGCELQELGGVCPAWVQKGASLPVERTLALGYRLLNLIAWYPYASAGITLVVITGGFVLGKKLKQTWRKTKIQKVKTSRSSQ